MFFNDLHENEEGRLNGRKKVAPSLTPSSVTPYKIPVSFLDASGGGW